MADDADAPIPLSALQHWAYCPRQCGLIHLEQAFADNIHTARGQAVHRPHGRVRIETPSDQAAGGVRALATMSRATGTR